MTKRKGRHETVPVYVDGKYVRSVTANQGSSEVAGKVLKRKPNSLNDKGKEVRHDRICRRTTKGWSCFYRSVVIAPDL